MNSELLTRLEGLHTVESAAKELRVREGTMHNILSKLRKQQYVTTWSGGGRKKRIYKITNRKQRPRKPGMWDIINKHSPSMQLNPWYDHQVHGTYGPEEALVDAVQTDSVRIIMASMHLFKAIKRWTTLYTLAKEAGVWRKIGALYDVARLYLRVRRMPSLYRKPARGKMQYLIKEYKTKEPALFSIRDYWRVEIPLRKGDLQEVQYDHS